MSPTKNIRFDHELKAVYPLTSETFIAASMEKQQKQVFHTHALKTFAFTMKSTIRTYFILYILF